MKLVLFLTNPEEFGKIGAIQELPTMMGITVEGEERIDPDNFYVENGSQVRRRPRLNINRDRGRIFNLPPNAKAFDESGEVDITNGEVRARNVGALVIRAWPYLQENFDINPEDLE